MVKGIVLGLRVLNVTTAISAAFGTGMIAGAAIGLVPVAPAGILATYSVRVAAAAMQSIATKQIVEHVNETFEAVIDLVEEAEEVLEDAK
jgi:hypothetical protein